jgi:hypothetical protein
LRGLVMGDLRFFKSIGGSASGGASGANGLSLR